MDRKILSELQVDTGQSLGQIAQKSFFFQNSGLKSNKKMKDY